VNRNKYNRFWTLVFTFAKRDIKIKYVQTFFGITWVIVQPVLGYLMLSLFFGKLFKASNQIADYSTFAYCGMMAWYYFSFVVSYSGVSLSQNQDLIQKTNIPKLVFPFSKAFSGLFEFCIWLIVIIIILFLKGDFIPLKIIFLPFFVLINLIAGLCVGIWVSAFTIKYRDFFHFIPYVIGIAIFITPVLYPIEMVPQNLKFLVYFNPMAGVIECYRWVILRAGLPSIQFLYGFILLFIFSILGLFYFNKVEKKMADII
jgi:lipopolysaccharide transport system permease protein